MEWPSERPDPATSFAVTKRRVLPTFQLDRAPATDDNAVYPSRRRDVVIFVHGYNYAFQESLFRLAQIATHGGLDEAPILFAWPSAASVTGYVADRDAITYSRDDLVRLLTIVTNSPDVGRITLFGHSMGAMLLAEALRQLRLTGRDRSIERLEDVVLAAPDIDIDVFRAQMEIIGRLDPPMTLLVAPDDRALRVSARLAGSRSRVGSRDVRDAQVQALAAVNGIRVIDISEVSAPDATRHSRFVELVTVFPRLRTEGRGTIAQTGAFLLQPLTAVLVPPHR
ncbi:MAG TPA: alpha/beta fold hydrolase [Rhodovulum sp.]|nr:alpha/beta fold hydrolase [Rhodovulum sp.]